MIRGSHALFRNWFNRSLKRLSVEYLEFTLYSLRRGGATFFFQSTGSLDLAVVRGRWENSKTARIYITEGLALLAGLSLTPSTRVLIQQAVDLFWKATAQLLSQTS